MSVPGAAARRLHTSSSDRGSVPSQRQRDCSAIQSSASVPGWPQTRFPSPFRIIKFLSVLARLQTTTFSMLAAR